MQLNKALKIGEFLVSNLIPGCVPGRCVIAGSARRRKAEVKDLEIVAMPLNGHPRPEFGQRIPDRSHLERQLRILVEDGWLWPIKGGEKFKKYEIRRLDDFGVGKQLNPFCLDLFLVTPPSQWGVTLMIRTGPGDFSRWMVTQKSKGGALPNAFFVQHNVVWFDGTQVPDKPEEAAKMMTDGNCIRMPEECDYFELCRMPVIEPKHRNPQWQKVSI